MKQVDYEREFMNGQPWPLERVKWKSPVETVVCMGSGPSLCETNAKAMAYELPGTGVPIFATNTSHGWCSKNCLPSMPVVVDPRVFRDNARKLLENPARRTFIAPSQLPLTHVGQAWADAADSLGWRRTSTLYPITFLRGGGPNADPWRPDVGINSRGGSVIFTAIQLAAYMGAKRIVLVGVDMDYRGRQKYWHDHEPLPDHHGVDYGSAREAFIWWRQLLAERGVELLNATVGGRIEDAVVPRVRLEDVL